VQVKRPGGVGYLNGIKAISAGASHSLALKEDGTVWAWGNNDSGKLGDGSTENHHTPVQVIGPGGVGYLTEIETISAGESHSMAICAENKIWAWGDGSYGCLGDGMRIDRFSPVTVRNPEDNDYFSEAYSVSAGDISTIALKKDGSVWGWGFNAYGQLGDGTTTNTNKPVESKINLGVIVPPPYVNILYWQHSNDSIKAWLMHEDKKQESILISDDVAPGWQVKTAYEMNNSDQSDLIFQHKDSGELVIWHMDDLERDYDAHILNPATGDNRINPDWEIKAVHDLKDDGRPDIIWQAIEGEHAGELAIWFGLEANNQENAYEASETGRLTHGDGKATVDPNWQLKAVYDLLDDGKPEVLWQAVSGKHEGQLAYWVLDGYARIGGGRLTHVGGSAYIDSAWQMMTVYDLLGNDKPEIIWQNIDGRVSYWELEESTRIGGGPLTPAKIDDNKWQIVGNHEDY